MYAGVALSLCLYALGLHCTVLTAWGSCFFLAPLFIAAHHLLSPAISFLYGMLIGTITYYPCFIALYTHIHWGSALLLTLVALSWYGIGIMLWIQSITLSGVGTLMRSACTVALTAFYYYYVANYCCLFFVRWCGLPMSIPLIPLMSYGSVQWAVCVSPGATLLALIACNGAIAHAWVNKLFVRIGVLMLLMGVCIQLSLQQQKQRAESIAVGFLTIATTDEQTIHERAHMLGQQLGKLCANRSIDIIISNETVFNENLAAMPELVALWYEYGLASDVHLFIGAYHQCAGALYNSIYWIHQGCIQSIYHKQLVIPGIETDHLASWQLPAWCMRAHNQSFRCEPSSLHEEPIWDMSIRGHPWHGAPRICADLFFLAPAPGADFIIGVINLHWCSSERFKRLLHHTALWWQSLSGTSIICPALDIL
ncbi:MAG: hypothetical protein WCE21_02470 [Candidatus Babeliales bacterium]